MTIQFNNTVFLTLLKTFFPSYLDSVWQALVDLWRETEE